MKILLFSVIYFVAINSFGDTFAHEAYEQCMDKVKVSKTYEKCMGKEKNLCKCDGYLEDMKSACKNSSEDVNTACGNYKEDIGKFEKCLADNPPYLKIELNKYLDKISKRCRDVKVTPIKVDD